jgi:GH15 family glucan-1,4-alpha-glucosidase
LRISDHLRCATLKLRSKQKFQLSSFSLQSQVTKVEENARKEQEGAHFDLNSANINKWKMVRRKKVLNEYKQISDYALIGDQRTCALIGIDGSIDWFCIPRFDSPSIFGALLDIRKAGSFRILPSQAEKDQFFSMQYYEGSTNILVTEFKNDLGHLRILDFMPCFKVEKTMISTAEIHRRVSCLEGKFSFEVMFDPRMDYGRVVPKITRVRAVGYSFSARTPETRQELAFITPFEFKAGSRGGLTLDLEISKKDKPIDFVLRTGSIEYHHTGNTFTDVKLEKTREYWGNLVQKCKVSGKWKDLVLRSALMLKLLVYSPTGAIIAAPTTSLPEEIGGIRNWDYRYSWIRDSSFVLWAMHSIGIDDLEEGYLDWLTSIFFMMAENLQVMLGVTGERDLTEKSLKHLEGYKKSPPVHVGNGAWNQFQLDVYGILLDALYFSHKHGKGINHEIYNYLIKLIVKSVEENWQKPDCGIWEVRGEREHFVYSKMWCWVALDRAAKIAKALQNTQDAEEISRLRDEIKNTILEKGYDNSIGAFVRSFGSKDLDSANLLMPQVRFIDANDPRMLSTINQTMKRLTENGFLYRYRSDDGLEGDEGAFLMCSFWLVTCLTMAGRLDEAEALLDKLAKLSNHVGLFSEEIDPKSGQMLGNFPQAFTHMGFMTAAGGLSKALEERDQGVTRHS